MGGVTDRRPPAANLQSLDPVSLGVIGGTFDPPHYGHLVLAENARLQLQLEAILFVLAGQPPHKPGRPITPVTHRAAMLETAIADNPAFILSHVDVNRPGPHYTVDMLTLLQQNYPAADLFFLMGEDSLAEFLSWRDPAGIVRCVSLVVMQRPGYTPDMEALERAAPGIRERLIWLDTPPLALSSSDLQRRAREGLSLRYLTPPSVEAYIHAHRLYTGELE